MDLNCVNRNIMQGSKLTVAVLPPENLFCHLKKKWVLFWHQAFATRYGSFATTYVHIAFRSGACSKYLLPEKMLISNTDSVIKCLLYTLFFQVLNTQTLFAMPVKLRGYRECAGSAQNVMTLTSAVSATWPINMISDTLSKDLILPHQKGLYCWCI